MKDWIDDYIDNEGSDSNNYAFGFASSIANGRTPNTLAKSLEEVLRRCSKQEKELNSKNFKKLKITVIDGYCFNTIRKLESKNDSKYEYIILLPEFSLKEKTHLVKHKIAHEIAHFLFRLQGKEFENQTKEEQECNMKAEYWGFPKNCE